MIKSMTGFASRTRDDDRGSLSVTLRAVNHRFLDLQVRLPAQLADLEPQVRAQVQRRLARGRVEVAVSLQLRQAPAPQVEINEEFATALAAVVEQARVRGIVTGGLSAGDLLRLPQALVIRERATDTETLGQVMASTMEDALGAALEELDGMRTREGAHLAADLDARLAELGALIDRVAAAAEVGRVQLEARLLERVRELAGAIPVDSQAVSQEIVRVAQRSDITEEITRFRGHLTHWTSLVAMDEPCGRKLDFLLQEMNREVNTIGAKADGLQVSEHIIQAKAELERMKEQVQNVE
ncbi:MAG: YicC/YloC family endoribonuclease [Vicinamibacterales bacterium]|nr:YicC/YloC family endoribonuclease [Vicinamibacterales bacterium]